MSSILFLINSVNNSIYSLINYYMPGSILGLPQWLSGKESACSAGDAGDLGLIPGSGSSRVGNGNPLQYFCSENPMDRGAWRATVHRVAKSSTQLKWLSVHACTGFGIIADFNEVFKSWNCFLRSYSVCKINRVNYSSSAHKKRKENLKSGKCNLKKKNQLLF